ncbi:MAG: hypothetical protein ACFE9S_07705, partial [Candidatus Hermodarchaeota archaeon]
MLYAKGDLLSYNDDKRKKGEGENPSPSFKIMAIITFSDIYNGAIVRCGQDTSDSTLVGYVKNWLNLR